MREKYKLRKTINDKLRQKIIEKYKSKCFMCGKLDGDIEKLVIHHKNHNPRCNKEDNLVLLCISCHRMIHLKVDKLKLVKENFLLEKENLNLKEKIKILEEEILLLKEIKKDKNYILKKVKSIWQKVVKGQI